jgi:hypothetical protein
VVNIRSNAPVVRSRTIATLATREHRDEREDPEHDDAEAVEGVAPGVADHVLHQYLQQRGHDEQQRDGAPVVAELAQHPCRSV